MSDHRDPGMGLSPPSPGAVEGPIDNPDTFGTSELREALSENGNSHTVVQPENRPTLAGWVNATPYDYDAYGTNGDHDWEGNARVYEWDGEMGDVGPEFPELEVELFGEPGTRASSGIDFSNIASIEVVQEGPVRVQPIANFQDAGLHPIMLKNVELAGYEVPTPIQRYCLPAIHMGHDVIAIAQTGSGKTAAYLVPILNKLMGKAKQLAAPRPNPVADDLDQVQVRAEPLVVIVCPTRELAVQIFNEARKFCYRTMLRPGVVYGGGAFKDQVAQLQKGCDVLIATPGRLIDFMNRPNQNLLTFRRVRYMVIDEADEMLLDDWKEDLDKILSGGDHGNNINYMLFSATFPRAARELAKFHLAETHVQIGVGRAGSSHENIKQTIVYVDPPMKQKALYDLLMSLAPVRTIIFVNYKRTAEELDDYLYNIGAPCSSMHSDRTQKEREATMRAFRSGKWPILIATGVTARGIDVRNVQHVINYDLPSMDHGGIEEYTHRIGRTGRIGHRGLATSFYSDKDEAIALPLTLILMENKQEIPDFLESYIPKGASAETLKIEDFENGSDFKDNTAGGDGDAWGAGTGDGDAWGAGNGDPEGANEGASALGTEPSKPVQPVEDNTDW